MSKIYKTADELIGKTPLLELSHIEDEYKLEANIIAKVEYFNPAGSVKDRIAKKMIDEAIKEGKINKDTVLIEPTSGNTGIGLASVAAAKGLKLIVTMPETMSVERRNIIKAYGAEIVLTEGAKGMKGAIEKANELAKEYPNSFIPGQFDNPNNPKVLDTSIYDEIIRVSNEDAFATGKLIGKKEGILVGISSGAAVFAAIELAKKEENKGKNIVVLLPDTGDRYLSTPMFSE